MTANSRRLLVIDDESLILESIGMTFPDFAVETCTSGQEGVDAFLKNVPDVVLCDIRLPDYSGMEIFEKLHRVDSNVPIILMTRHFTGADRKRLGKFELCKNGTLLLDEIGDMTPLMQTKILRVLQNQTFGRVGGTETIKTHARVVAATNRDLAKAIKDKEFRELQSAVKHALLETTGTMIPPSSLPNSIIGGSFEDSPTRISPSESGAANTGNQNSHFLDFVALTRQLLESGSDEIHRELISRAERQIIMEVLEYTAGNLTQASKRLGVTRTTLRTRMESLGLSYARAMRLEDAN